MTAIGYAVDFGGSMCILKSTSEVLVHSGEVKREMKMCFEKQLTRSISG